MLKKIDKKLKYIIIFWNGEKQYREHFLKIKKLKKILGNNLNFFFTGNATQIKNVIFADRFTKFNNIKFYNASIRHTICFKYPLLFSLLSILKNLIFFIKYNNKKKICFTGLVKVDDKLINHLSNDWRFSKKSVEILLFLKLFNKKKIFEEEITKKLQKYLNSKYFVKLQTYEKYFMSQIIFRNLLMNLLKNNDNFYLQDWDNRSKIMDSLYFKKFVFLDLGSTAGSEKVYFRYLVLKFFKKKTLRLNFFDKYKKLDFQKSNKDMFNYFEKLKNSNIEKYNFDKLLSLIKFV